MTIKMNHQILEKRRKISLGIICISIIMIIFLVGLWPLNFHPKNQVEWLPDKNGIRFYGNGIVYSSGSLKDQEQKLFQSAAISIEVCIQPENVPHNHFAYIFTLYDGEETEYFTIGQWNNALEIFENRIIDTMNIESLRVIGLGDALPDSEVKLITLSSDPEGTAIYKNGKLAKFFPGYSLISKHQFKNGQLILGNSSNGSNAWIGNIFGLAIYNRLLGEEEVLQHYQAWLKNGSPESLENKGLVLFYRFDEHQGALVNNHSRPYYDLLIPTTFHVPHKTVLSLPCRDFRLSPSYFTDVFINIAGFIPFGFFFFAFLNSIKQDSRLKNYLLTVLFGGGISLGIELIQVYLPTRSSSLTDLICNMQGTFIGIILFKLLEK